MHAILLEAWTRCSLRRGGGRRATGDPHCAAVGNPRFVSPRQSSSSLALVSDQGAVNPIIAGWSMTLARSIWLHPSLPSRLVELRTPFVARQVVDSPLIGAILTTVRQHPIEWLPWMASVLSRSARRSLQRCHFSWSISASSMISSSSLFGQAAERRTSAPLIIRQAPKRMPFTIRQRQIRPAGGAV